MKVSDYCEEVLKLMPPETMRRIEKEATASKKSVADVVKKILDEGVNTPIAKIFAARC